MRRLLNMLVPYLLLEEAANTELPMDFRSRMRRASQLGFNLIAYHATHADFDAFRSTDHYGQQSLGTHVGTADQAHSIIRASRMEKRIHGADFSLNSRMMPLLIRGTNWLRLPDLGAEHIWNVHHILHHLSWEEPEIYERIKIADRFNPTLGDIRTSLEQMGYDGIVYKNEFEGDKNMDSFIVFDPANIRSVFAVFDPAKSSSPNLMA